MKLLIDDLDLLYELSNFKINTIIVKDVFIYRKILSNLYSNFQKNDIKIYLDKNILILDDKNSLFIDNLFNSILNEKIYLNKFYKKIALELNEDLIHDLDKIRNSVDSIVGKIEFNYETEFSIESFSLDNMLKLCSLSFKNKDDICLNFISVIKNMSSLFNIKYFFTLNLHTFLTKSELYSIVNELKYLNIILVNIEFNNLDESYKDENCLIIDEDKCIY